MGLTIVQVAYSLAPVVADASGGAEHVIALLDEELTRLGHRSIVVACRGSRVHGTLESTGVDPRGVLDTGVIAGAERATRETIDRVLARESVDLVHVHGVDFARTLPDTRAPLLVTLHLPASYYEESAWNVNRERLHVHAVSWSQHASLPNDVRGRALSPIENGIDLRRVAFRRRKHGYAMTLGRICPEKGYVRAIEAARLAGVPLLLAGEVFGYEAHRRHFDEELVPRLSSRARFIGPIRGARKRRLLSGASCLLVPSLVPETSSLVVMEALASGTPVIATPVGALAEYVEHERTGFLAEDVADIAHAIRRAPTIDPAACRSAAELRFDHGRMVASYLATYRRIVDASGSYPRRASLRLDEACSLERIEDLGDDWNALWSRVPTATVFQSFDWCLSWYRHLGTGTARVLVARRNGRVSGILPLARHGDGTLSIAGAGITDTLDVLAEPEDAEAVCLLVLEHLRKDASVRTIELTDLPPESAWCAIAGRYPASDLSMDHAPHTTRLLIDFRALDRPRYPSKLARNLRRAEARARDEGARWELASHEALDEHLQSLFRHHAARWAERGETGVLADDCVQSFHREMASRACANGSLLLSGLRVRGQLMASLLAYHSRNHVLFYISGFDATFAHMSPVALCIAKTIEEGWRRGARMFDFLRGEERYKYAWNPIAIVQRRVSIRRTQSLAQST